MYSRADSRYSNSPSHDRVQRDSNKSPRRGVEEEGFGMTEQKDRPRQERARQDRLRQEREEIAGRIANFRATQQRFERAREEYFEATMENARKTARPSFWP
ncbi:MAG TPA: hypothetical protein VMT86_08125 [Bryobacteraceae bacterium]|nr:hypothetical protein [Bryobacteraceae bacterium]